jgi:hypothetical protein
MVNEDRVKLLVNMLSTFSFTSSNYDSHDDSHDDHPVLFFSRQNNLPKMLDLLSFYFNKYARNASSSEIIVSEPPLLDNDDDDDFVSPELKLIKKLPFRVLHLPCLYYSFALFCLDYIDVLVEDRGLLLLLGYPSLYYFFERCLHPDPSYRHWLYI